MSYAQRKELSGNRAVSIFMTVLVVGSLLYAIVSGLAYKAYKQSVDKLKVVDVEQPPPPPKEPPPPPKDMPKVPPPPSTPPPLVQINTPPPQTIQMVTAPPPIAPAPPTITPPAPPAPPPPPRKTVSAQPSRGDVRNLFSGDDYPPSAADAGATGTAQATLTIGADGRVTGCNLTRSTGNGALDAATCNILRRRAKFSPARDSNGNPTTDTYTTPPISWRLEG